MKYICSVCGYVYDEQKEGKPFKELPDDWHCPWCGAPKSEFQPEEAGNREQAAAEEKPVKEQAAEVKPAGKQAADKEDYVKLSAGQFAAVCSNLAKGCEKQYFQKEALLFRELAEHFMAAVPAVPDASIEKLVTMLGKDIAERYPTAKGIEEENKDRGALRACTWGEKVTRMLNTLVKRYLTEGERLLADTEVWVCTVCGFVHIGDAPPRLCPVCKVPEWKFEKIEGRDGR